MCCAWQRTPQPRSWLLLAPAVGWRRRGWLLCLLLLLSSWQLLAHAAGWRQLGLLQQLAVHLHS